MSIGFGKFFVRHFVQIFNAIFVYYANCDKIVSCGRTGNAQKIKKRGAENRPLIRIKDY